MLTLHIADGHQQHVAVAILDGLVVDAAQVVSSQKALQEEQDLFFMKLTRVFVVLGLLMNSGFQHSIFGKLLCLYSTHKIKMADTMTVSPDLQLAGGGQHLVSGLQGGGRRHRHRHALSQPPDVLPHTGQLQRIIKHKTSETEQLFPSFSFIDQSENNFNSRMIITGSLKHKYIKRAVCAGWNTIKGS